VHGKGYFSVTNGGLRYRIPEGQSQPLDKLSWFLGLFVDLRFPNDSTLRTLVEFPDGSMFGLKGRDEVVYRLASGQQVVRALRGDIGENRYTHLGLRFVKGGKIELFKNGMLIDVFNNPEQLQFFKVGPGELWVGRGAKPGNGFVGWIDEFKMVADAQGINPEELCNFASGTIIGLGNEAPKNLLQLVNRFGSTAQELIRQAIAGDEHPTYLCYTGNRSPDGWVNLDSLPRNTTSQRQALLFPEGPVKPNQARPDSRQNSFCVSCHHDDGSRLRPVALTLDALAPKNIPAKLDPRRQPSQGPSKIFGNIPQGFFGESGPAESLQVDEGLLIDDFISGRQP
jgi:hypothetical protein